MVASSLSSLINMQSLTLLQHTKPNHEIHKDLINALKGIYIIEVGSSENLEAKSNYGVCRNIRGVITSAPRTLRIMATKIKTLRLCELEGLQSIILQSPLIIFLSTKS
jgi:hypothetical protein